MSNYFANKNNQNAEIQVRENKVYVAVVHGNHTHTLDITNATAEDLLNNPGKVFGDAHRKSTHDKK